MRSPAVGALVAVILTAGVWAGQASAQGARASAVTGGGESSGPPRTSRGVEAVAHAITQADWPRRALQTIQVGLLDGIVVDETGLPLAGVAVTVHGTRIDFAVTDRNGRFRFAALPQGAYFVRAQLAGFGAGRRELVQVYAARSVSRTLQLTALDAQRQLLTAGIGGIDPAEADDDAETDHSHSPGAWRLRHVTRSVLREVETTELPDERSTFDTGAREDIGSTLSFFGPSLLSGQVQLLTISTFDTPQELFSAARIPHNVAYVSFAAPAGPVGTWAVQAALTDGDVSSWLVGGSYNGVFAGRHTTDFGMSYAAQRYNGANPLALSAMGETSRIVGEMRASDRWQLTPRVSIAAGAHYAHYGYIDSPGLFSPSFEGRFQPNRYRTIRASVSQQMVAPGAEEFVPSMVAGLWMPPQRTFSPLVEGYAFRPERTRHYELAVDHQLGPVTLSTRGFRQVVGDQIVTIFGLRKGDGPRGDVGHYFTATAGKVEMFGWGVTVSRSLGTRVRGSVSYTLAHANWINSPDASIYAALARSAERESIERIHDITSSVETSIPATATRLVAVYRINSGYTSDDTLQRTPGFSGRFNVQVNQRLPFVPLGTTEWEVLVAVRNLFHDNLDGSSLYDELLVVRPPKRFVGGLTVRF